MSNLRVEDKNIELGLLDDSTEGNDSAIDDGGIILRSSDFPRFYMEASY